MFVTVNPLTKPKKEGYVSKGRTLKKSDKAIADKQAREEKKIRSEIERQDRINYLQELEEEKGLTKKEKTQLENLLTWKKEAEEKLKQAEENLKIKEEAKKTRKINFEGLLRERESLPPDIACVPKSAREGAVHDLYDAQDSLTAKLYNGDVSAGVLDFRRKKQGRIHPIHFEAKEFRLSEDRKKVSLFPRFLGNDLRLTNDKGLKKLAASKIKDSKITYDKGEWFLSISYLKKEKFTQPEDQAIALDPGIATFQTGFSPSETVKFQQTRKIKLLNKKIDTVRALCDRGMIKKKSFKKFQTKILRKISYLIDELHYKTANYLMKNNSTIFLPSFETQKLTRKFAKESNREIYNLSHYRFKTRLTEKCGASPYHTLHIVDESYTSLTCSKCGNVKSKGGLKLSDRTYNCSVCKMIMDRDVNAARNIYLKHMPLL
jgi:transposase